MFLSTESSERCHGLVVGLDTRIFSFPPNLGFVRVSKQQKCFEIGVQDRPLSIHLCTYMYVCIYTYLYIYIYVYVYIYICTWAHPPGQTIQWFRIRNVNLSLALKLLSCGRRGVATCNYVINAHTHLTENKKHKKHKTPNLQLCAIYAGVVC